MKKFFLLSITGFFSGMLNGLFGSGGGIVAVPLLSKTGLSQKEAQATALFMMLCLSIISAALYFQKGQMDFSLALVFLPFGIGGAIFGSMFFRKINPFLLRKIFGGFVLFSAGRMLWGILSEWI